MANHCLSVRHATNHAKTATIMASPTTSSSALSAQKLTPSEKCLRTLASRSARRVSSSRRPTSAASAKILASAASTTRTSARRATQRLRTQTCGTCSKTSASLIALKVMFRCRMCAALASAKSATARASLVETAPRTVKLVMVARHSCTKSDATASAQEVPFLCQPQQLANHANLVVICVTWKTQKFAISAQGLRFLTRASVLMSAPLAGILTTPRMMDVHAVSGSSEMQALHPTHS